MPNKNTAIIKQKGDRGGVLPTTSGPNGRAPFGNQNGPNNADVVGNGPGAKKQRVIGTGQN